MTPQDIPFYFSQGNFSKQIRMPTAAEVKVFSDRLDVRFPEEYISLIIDRAGHAIYSNVVYPIMEEALDGSLYPSLTDLGLFLHYDIERDYEYSIQNRYDWYNKKYRTPLLVPFSETSVSGDLSFDFRMSRTHPKIVLTNIYNWVPDHDELILSSIADSFSELFEKLMTRDEFEAKYGSMN